MPRGVPHSPELRAQVVAAVLAGTTIAQTARQFGVSKSLVSEWSQTPEVRTVRTEKKDDLQTLIARYLEVGFHAMIQQAEVMGDPEYCRTQDADKLAISHGVLGDKLAGVAATAQALGLVGPAAAAAADHGAAEPRQLDAAGASAATGG
jgi:hypothetical protein